MEKILFALDATKLDNNTLEFSCYLSLLTQSKLYGVFLENIVAEEKPVLKHVHGVSYVDWVVDEKSEKHKAKMELIEKNISLFEATCTEKGISYDVHRDDYVPASELIEESRFADVLVVDAETSFKKHDEETPTAFLTEILKKSECPVIIAPEKFEAVDEIIFTYNTSPSSVFAIKQFTYLFPQLSNKKVTIIQVNEEGKWKAAEKYKFQEWLKQHYTNLNFTAIMGKGDTELFKKKKYFPGNGCLWKNYHIATLYTKPC
jgi:hypothetical protein